MGAIIVGRVKCGGRPWTTTTTRTQWAPQAGCPLFVDSSSLSVFLYVSFSVLFSLDLDSWHGKPPGLPRRNMLANTSDTLGFGVCHAVLIIPRRIPSAGYLPPGTCTGDIMWESKRIRRSRASRDATFLRGVKTRKGVVSHWISTKMIAVINAFNTVLVLRKQILI